MWWINVSLRFSLLLSHCFLCSCVFYLHDLKRIKSTNFPWWQTNFCDHSNVIWSDKKYLACFPLGGYTVGPKPLIDLLRQRSRPYLFSNALPPPVVGSAIRAVELLLASNEIAQSMTAKTMRFVFPLKEGEADCPFKEKVWFWSPLWMLFHQVPEQDDAGRFHHCRHLSPHLPRDARRRTAGLCDGWRHVETGWDTLSDPENNSGREELLASLRGSSLHRHLCDRILLPSRTEG